MLRQRRQHLFSCEMFPAIRRRIAAAGERGWGRFAVVGAERRAGMQRRLGFGDADVLPAVGECDLHVFVMLRQKKQQQTTSIVVSARRIIHPLLDSYHFDHRCSTTRYIDIRALPLLSDGL